MNTYVVTDKLHRADDGVVLHAYASRTPCDDICRISLDDSPEPDAIPDPSPDVDANAVTDADAEAVAAVGVVGVVGVAELDSPSSKRDSWSISSCSSS